MVVIKGINVSIHTDGKPLEERQDTSIEEDNVSKTTRYIEATSGQLFSINMFTPSEDQFEGDLLSYDIFIDGRLVDNPLLQKGSPLMEEESSGLLMPDGTIRPFRFADLAVEEHDPTNQAKKTREEYKDVGKIVIRVDHKNMGEASTLYVDPAGWKEIDAVDEKTLKGQSVSLSVGLAPPVEAEGSSLHYKTSFIDPERVPFAVITFLYRSAEKLAEIFIPTPTASPEPEETMESMRARIQELQGQLQEALPTSQLIRGTKRERTENESNDGPVRQSRRQKVVAYMAFVDDDDEQGFEEIEAPVRPSQPSTQID